MKRCVLCGFPEYCFTKYYVIETSKGDRVIAAAFNEFWLCQNKRCMFCIPVETEKFSDMVFDNRGFYWKLNSLTQLNLRAAEQSIQNSA